MSFFRSLRTRLILGLNTMLLIIVLIGLGSYFSLRNTIDAFQVVVNELMTEIHHIRELQNTVLQAAMPANDYLIHGRKDERVNFKRLSDKVNRQFEHLLSLAALSAEKRRLIQNAYSRWRHASTLSSEILELSRPVGNATAVRAMEYMDGALKQAVEILAKVNLISHREIEAHLVDAKHAGKQAFLLLIYCADCGDGNRARLRDFIDTLYPGPDQEAASRCHAFRPGGSCISG